MEENKDQNQDQSQGKQSTAETDVTYNLDLEELRHSATTSMADADVDLGSSGDAGNGGVDELDELREDDADTTEAGS